MTTARAAVRPEIQALRALAVALVVVYHYWPDAVPGGYIGVDVFFAISGFLITSHLLREADRTGRVSLPAFYARRARRILPAALLVLLAVAIATLLFVPQVRWGQYFAEIRASTLYVENWYLAHAAVDYLAAANAASPVQHFWSLSVEEQFYLVWPLVLLLGIAVTHRGRLRARRRPVVLGLLGLLTGASLAYGIADTAADPAQAFFVTPTRVWEFGAGGLLALLAVPDRTASPLRAAVSWLGLGAIAIGAFAYTPATPFPGSAALLPILAALAVIWAGAPTVAWAPTWLLRRRPIQFLGDVSYSVYLWHWPLLILAPFVVGNTVRDGGRVGLLALTILLAWGTKALVEDPVRASTFLRGHGPRWTFAHVLAGTAVVLAATLIGNQLLDAKVQEDIRQTRRVLAAKPTCLGPAALDPRHRPCVNPKLRDVVVPTPVEAQRTGNAPCPLINHDELVPVCAFNVPGGRPAGTVAMIGDSHTMHWRGALAVVAHRLHWRGISITRSGCPLTAAIAPLPGPRRGVCLAWKDAVVRWLADHPSVHTIFVSDRVASKVEAPVGVSQLETKAAGYIAMWKRLPASVRHIVVLRDTPAAQYPSCPPRAMADGKRVADVCTSSRSQALKRDPEVAAARRLHSRRVQVIDMTNFFCDDKRCHEVIGGTLAYKDDHHMTLVYSTALGPYLLRYVDQLVAGWPDI